MVSTEVPLKDGQHRPNAHVLRSELQRKTQDSVYKITSSTYILAGRGQPEQWHVIELNFCIVMQKCIQRINCLSSMHIQEERKGREWEGGREEGIEINASPAKFQTRRMD